MEPNSVDSSIDGQLADFYTTYGIDNYNTENMPIPLDNAISEIGVAGDGYFEEPSGQFEAGDLLMPACSKLNKLLTHSGYKLETISEEHIDMENRSVSIFVVDTWADSLFIAVSELIDRQKNVEGVISESNTSFHKEALSSDVLMNRVSDLQTKLLDVEKKEKLAAHQNNMLEEQVLDLNKKYKNLQSDSKMQLKHLEQKNQEHERRVRAKESELQRLQEKLAAIANSDRNVSQSNKKSLVALHQGEIINTISSKNMKKSSLNSSFASNTSIASLQGSPSPRKGSGTHASSLSPVYMTEVINALEAQKDVLVKDNKDLQKQVTQLTRDMKEQMNTNGVKHSNNKGKTSGSLHKGTGSGYIKTYVLDDQCDGDNSDGSDEDYRGGERGDDNAQRQSGKAALWNTIQQQKTRIKQLEHRCEIMTVENAESEQTIVLMRSRASELREEIENLRLECESRPALKQFSEAQRTIKELEEKLHDVIMMRKEAQELNAWRKHLSTAERIKIDKRNHELGLWLVDSLPKVVIKDVLQAVCRELNLTDISEVQPTLIKLKTVIKAVPRMERFITNICAYVFERQLPILPPSRAAKMGIPAPDDPRADNSSVDTSKLVMEDVLPVLKSWWHSCSYLEELKSFEDVLLKELHRREHLLGQMNKDKTDDGEKGLHDNTTLFQDMGFGTTNGASTTSWEVYGKIQWSRRDRNKVIDIIRELIDFQVEVFTYKSSLVAAEEYILSNPESLVNRLVSHVKYLFSINTLDGLIPRMNQVYLYTEEMSNFMTSMRDMLNMRSGDKTDAAVQAEIQRIVMASVKTSN